MDLYDSKTLQRKLALEHRNFLHKGNGEESSKLIASHLENWIIRLKIKKKEWKFIKLPQLSA